MNKRKKYKCKIITMPYARVEDDFMYDPITLGDAPWDLCTYQGVMLVFTTRFPSRKAMYLLSINCCTLALKTLQASFECPIDHSWYPHCTSGSYPSGYGYGNDFRGLGSTNELWIRDCRIWLHDMGIRPRGAFLIPMLLWGLCWL